MFENVGQKIQTVAKVYFWLIAISSLIGGIVLTVEMDEVIYLLVAIGGTLFAYLTALMLYGYGEIIENSARAASGAALASRKANEIAADVKSLAHPKSE